jgi:type I restriction enzyme S subunit
VARVEELAALIEEARGLRAKAREEADAFVASLHLKLAQDRTIRMDEILTLDEQQESVESGNKYTQVGIRGFGQGLFAKEALDGAQTSYRAFNRLYAGAVVLSQPKGWEGAIAVCPPELDGMYASPEYRTFRCIPGEAMPEYLAEVVITPWFWIQLKNLSRGLGARRQRTRPEQFLTMKIPMPTIDRQKQAISVFRDLRTLTDLQEATQPELDALLPSVLDRAFRGEL